jgi:hypothetical protein
VMRLWFNSASRVRSGALNWPAHSKLRVEPCDLGEGSGSHGSLREESLTNGISGLYYNIWGSCVLL